MYECRRHGSYSTPNCHACLNDPPQRIVTASGADFGNPVWTHVKGVPVEELPPEASANLAPAGNAQAVRDEWRGGKPPRPPVVAAAEAEEPKACCGKWREWRMAGYVDELQKGAGWVLRLTNDKLTTLTFCPWCGHKK